MSEIGRLKFSLTGSVEGLRSRLPRGRGRDCVARRGDELLCGGRRLREDRRGDGAGRLEDGRSYRRRGGELTAAFGGLLI